MRESEMVPFTKLSQQQRNAKAINMKFSLV
jgi:hypothetical protein